MSLKQSTFIHLIPQEILSLSDSNKLINETKIYAQVSWKAFDHNLPAT
jgi:hypothetical protein